MAIATIKASSAMRFLDKEHAEWDIAHDAAAADDVKDILIQRAGAYLSAGLYHFYRQCLFFDGSELDPGIMVNRARIRLWVYQRGTDYFQYIHIVEGLFSNPVVVADYGSLLSATTSGGGILINDVVEDQYNEIDLNAAGIGWLNIGGLIKLALRGERDIDDDNPGNPFNNTIWYYSWAEAGKEPELLLDYRVGLMKNPSSELLAGRFI